MSFQRGQGLNHALQDARELCHAVEECWQSADFTEGGGIEVRRAAITAYEAGMKERGGREVKLSAENTRMLHCVGEVERSGVVKHGLTVGREGGSGDGKVRAGVGAIEGRG